jgi:hypothetical protein
VLNTLTAIHFKTHVLACRPSYIHRLFRGIEHPLVGPLRRLRDTICRLFILFIIVSYAKYIIKTYKNKEKVQMKLIISVTSSFVSASWLCGNSAYRLLV